MEFLGQILGNTDQPGAQSGHGLRVDAPHGDDLVLVSFEGTEAMSEPFAFDVVVSTPCTDEDFARDMLGADATLTLAPELDGPTRVIHGVIADVRTGLPTPPRGRARVQLRVVPRIALAAHRRDTRVFQDLHVREVIARTLRPYGVEVLWRVEAPSSPRSYCTQYEETDLDFVRRLLAEEGCAWFTEHQEAAIGDVVERIVCLDVPTRWPSMDGDALPFSRAEGTSTREERVLRFDAAEAVGVGAVAMRGYDLAFPQRELDAVARDPRALRHRDEAAAEVYLHHDEGQEPDVRRSRARHRLAQARRDIERAAGTSNCARLRPGYRFALTDHPAASLDRRWVPTRVTHRGRVADTEGFTAQERTAGYENEFQCVPAERPFPPATPPRRILQVTETATVVGPSGEDIHVDGLGRVQVRFHWERRAQSEAISCWIPVTQPWAGGGWGTQFIPRVGMEVLVTFLGGDPDRPVVLGCLPSSSAPPPFPLPEQRTRSGIRTHGTPDGGAGHELVFEDLSGSEFVGLTSRRDLHLRAARDAELTAGQDLTLRATGAMDVSVGGGHALHVDGAMSSRARGGRTEVTGGALLSEVGGRRAEVTDGDWVASVGGAMDLGARGDLTLSAGCEDPGTLSLRAEGDLSLSASDRVEITARTEIVLRCGASEVVISPRGVEIRAPRVRIHGEDGVEAVGDGTRLSLGSEEALVSARRVRLYSEGASVSLDRDAHVRGREVLLNCDDDPRPDAPTDPRDPARVPLRLRVTDAALNPLAHKHFHVDAGGETLKGETDGDGWVRVRVLETARAARVVVWTDAYPRGARREWTVTLGRLAPVASPKGLKERLRNLGWYEGAVDNDDDDALALALRSFQEDNGLPPHGAPDDATRAKITALHGA